MKGRLYAGVGIVVFLLVLQFFAPVQAQEVFIRNTSVVDGFQPSFVMQVGARKYFNSFTSWEFPNVIPPLDPLSRLEWPWDQTFFVARTGMSYTNLALILELSGTLSMLSNPKAQDSDWTFPDNPNQKTIFSEGDAKPYCWIFDVGITAPLSRSSNLKGVAGYRISKFKFTYTDITQRSLDPRYDRGFMPGPAIEFVQYYQHWYAGGVFDGAVDLRNIARGVRLPVLLLRLQLDGAYVTGKNYDDHVARSVPTTSEVRSNGVGWHVNVSTGIQRGSLKFDVEADLRKIYTKGSMHDMEGSTDRSWDDARVWSEQKYLGASGAVLF